MDVNMNSTICVVGITRIGTQNPINHVHQSLIGSFIVDTATGVILQAQFNTVCAVTSEFLADLLVGLSFTDDLDKMCALVQSRYLGDSRKAIQVVLKDAASKFRQRLPAEHP